MKKYIIVIMIMLTSMLLIADIRCFATDSSFDEAQLKDYINEAQKYDLSGMNFEIENNVNDNNAEKIFKKVYNMLFKELRQSFHIMLYLIIICILSSLSTLICAGFTTVPSAKVIGDVRVLIASSSRGSAKSAKSSKNPIYILSFC